VGALPLGRRGHLIAQLSREDRPDLDEETGFTEWTAGARALFGSPKINGFVEILGESRDVDDDVAIDPETGLPLEEDDDTGVWSAGIEARVAEGLWASAGFGSRFAAVVDDAEKTFVLIGLRWGISSQARIDALGGATSNGS
jgi:hypothetical protein